MFSEFPNYKRNQLFFYLIISKNILKNLLLKTFTVADSESFLRIHFEQITLIYKEFKKISLWIHKDYLCSWDVIIKLTEMLVKATILN